MCVSLDGDSARREVLRRSLEGLGTIRRLKRDMSSKTPENDDIPASLRAMAAEAGPARVVSVDVDEARPELRADHRYKNAWVVLCKNDIPRCMVMLNLEDDATQIQSRLEELVHRIQTSWRDESVVDVVPDRDLPKISVVVPTTVERIEELGRCLEAIERLDYPPHEVIVVDNRPKLPLDDPLPALVADKPWVKVVHETRRGVSAARNAGVAAASGEVIAFTDDDVIVDAHWLRAIGSRLTLDPGTEAITGLIVPAELETPSQIWFERYFGGFGSERTFSSITLEVAPSRRFMRGSRVLVRDAKGAEQRRFSIYGVGAYGAGANMAFRKSTLERLGGFDPVLGVGTPAPGGEDLVVLINILRQGGRVGYEPAAYVHHRHRREYSQLLKQIDGYGLGYTAMLVALIRRDRRHVLCLLSQLPAALKWKSIQGVQRIGQGKSRSTSSQNRIGLYPSELFKRELLAYLRGPFAYLRSVRAWRAILATHSPSHR
jgi:glycosyltransferase involved in cell wall biosynthesis